MISYVPIFDTVGLCDHWTNSLGPLLHNPLDGVLEAPPSLFLIKNKDMIAAMIKLPESLFQKRCGESTKST
jgi:hypothetical protein